MAEIYDFKTGKRINEAELLNRQLIEKSLEEFFKPKEISIPKEKISWVPKFTTPFLFLTIAASVGLGMCLYKLLFL